MCRGRWRAPPRILAFVGCFECCVRGSPFEHHVVDGERRRGQRFGAWGVTGPARLGRRIAPYFAFSWTKPQASDAHGVGEIACRNRPFAGALQFADGEHALTAGDAQSIFGEA